MATRRYSKSASKDVESAMRRRKRGTLKSSSGRKVSSRKQAVAIGLSEARKKGKKVPKKRATGAATTATRRKAATTATRRKATVAARKSAAARRRASPRARSSSRPQASRSTSRSTRSARKAARTTSAVKGRAHSSMKR